jgi:hypothetical protein
MATMTPKTGAPQPAGALPMSDQCRVVVTWHPPEGWSGHIERDGHRLAEVTTPRLELLEAHTRTALIGIADRRSIALFDLDIELHVPPRIDDALKAGVPVHEVVGVMQLGLNMFADDIATVLQRRLDSPEVGRVGRAVVTNADIAAHGLDPWPDVFAVQCVALGANTTTWCRACAQANLTLFKELTWGNSVLISTGTVRCIQCCRTTGTTSGPRAVPRGDRPAPAPPDLAATPEGR